MKLNPKTNLPVPSDPPLTYVAFVVLAPIAILAGVLWWVSERKHGKK
jgi:hypothetical protein